MCKIDLSDEECRAAQRLIREGVAKYRYEAACRRDNCGVLSSYARFASSAALKIRAAMEGEVHEREREEVGGCSAER